jgi:hypothetical protein
MPDPIWLDTNVVLRAIKGDLKMQGELKAFRDAGRELLIVPAVKSEVLNGNPLTMKSNKPVWEQTPNPGTKVAFATAMQKMGIKVDYDSRKIPRGTRVDYAMQEHVPLPKNVKTRPPLTNISLSDSLVLSEIKASAEARGIQKPQIFTAEQGNKAMITQSGKYGVEPVTPKWLSPSPGSGSGPGDPGPGPASSPPKINLEDYPPEREGPVTRFFKDRPALKKAGLIGASIAASQVSGRLLDAVTSHFSSAADQARKEFQAKYPDPASLAQKARIDQHRKAYEASLTKLRAPSGAKAVGGMMVLLTPEKDRDAAWKTVQANLSKVKLASGATGGYGDAASAYINAMADLMTELANYQKGLPEIADDISRRASVLQRQGDDLMQTYFAVAPAAAISPVVYYQWMDVHNLASVFLELGSQVGGVASQVGARANEYQRLAASLDRELIKISEELGRYVP